MWKLGPWGGSDGHGLAWEPQDLVIPPQVRGPRWWFSKLAGEETMASLGRFEIGERLGLVL